MIRLKGMVVNMSLLLTGLLQVKSNFAARLVQNILFTDNNEQQKNTWKGIDNLRFFRLGQQLTIYHGLKKIVHTAKLTKKW